VGAGATTSLPSDYAWELYDLRADFSQAHDLASAREPGKTRQLRPCSSEAERNQVLPLDNRLSMDASWRPRASIRKPAGLHLLGGRRQRTRRQCRADR
jgi:hypothetical protein